MSIINVLSVPERTVMLTSHGLLIDRYVRHHGILQFLHIYKTKKDLRKPTFLWGDEVEYFIVAMDHVAKTAFLSLRAKDLLDGAEHLDVEQVTSWRPEYASYMVEGTPGKP